MPRGGKRSGSGRKAVRLSRTDKKLKRVEAEEILAAEDNEKESWLELLSATTTVSVAVVYPDGKQDKSQPDREFITVPDNKIRLEARKYLTDRRDGKPAQAVHHSGEEGGPFRVLVEHIGS